MLADRKIRRLLKDGDDAGVAVLRHGAGGRGFVGIEQEALLHPTDERTGREADPHAHPALPVVLQSGDGRAVVVLAKAWGLRAGIGAQVEPVGGVGVCLLYTSRCV